MRVSSTLVQADQDGNRTPFKLLDRIFALPPDEQTPPLRELTQRIVRQTDLADLLGRVTEELCRKRGREMKRVVLEEQRKVA